MLLFEDFFDSALVICKCSNKGKKTVLNLFLPELVCLVTEASACYTLRQEALRTLNSILDGVPREERKKFPHSEEIRSLTKDLAKTILEAGDYDLQVALSEALCRLITKKWRDDLVHHWFEDNYLAEAFKKIKDREFETDCRKFLNQLNERLGNERRVYSFPCISAFADMNEVKKPSDEKLEEFWIDFNTGNQSVTFYVDNNEGTLWDSVRLSKEAVSSYSLKDDDGQKIVKIYMKIPVTLNKTEATKFKLSFSAEFDILNTLRTVLGDEKMMITVAEEESVHAGKQARQNEAVIPKSTNPQDRKDPSNSENVETPLDNLASQHSQQVMVNSDVNVVTVSQQVESKDANQVVLSSSEKKSKTPSPRTETKPSEKLQEEEAIETSMPKILQLFSFQKDVSREKRNEKTRSAKQRAKGRKESYDFENSDTESHEKVTAAKEKILGQGFSSQNQRSYDTGNVDSNKRRRRASNYRKHLFSESNGENTSTGQSEKSWILDSQKQSLPKSLDYTRKKPRMRSKLKVLLLSSASSGSDYQTKKGASRQREKRTSNSKGDNLPTEDLADEMLSEEPEGDLLSIDVPAKGHSSDEEKATQRFHSASDQLSKEESSKRKSSDALSGNVIKKKKLSNWETNHLSSDASCKPRKLFDSVEREAEIYTGQEMDDSVDDALFSKMLHEDFGDSGVITAFESFIVQLKKLFWSRYKRMETSAQNALRTSEKNVCTLLNQIHEYRLSKLETFPKIVAEELSSLEKEIQLLANMEKDAVEFCNAQLLKLNSFCNQQKPRIQSVDSALGETARSFADTIRNTTREYSMEKGVENNVYVIPSD
ncbi:synaptonemal complex protein 2-like [Colius striatus]|uniref:synaptonemal complex protein 2-like n=1 Tax=Colius striatus TaxID=57412 RepID=UPI002B1D38FB|nr:synaptonemal complex protein 2-like [Colius striatus]